MFHAVDYVAVLKNLMYKKKFISIGRKFVNPFRSQRYPLNEF